VGAASVRKGMFWLSCLQASFVLEKGRKLPEFVTFVFSGKGVMKQARSAAVHTLKALILVDEFYISVSVHHKSIIHKEPTRCNLGQYCVY